MKRSTRPLPFAIVLGAAALLLPGCRDESTAPEQGPQPAVRADADRYIVVLKEVRAAAATATSADVSRLGGRIERSHAEIGVLQVRGGPSVAAELRKRADVEAVVKDRKVQWLPPVNRRVSGSQKFRAQSNQRGAQFFDVFQWNIKKIRAQRAWNVSTQGAGVTVCVLDTGVDPRQIDLVGKLDLGISASFVGNERADRDFAAHGTYMASIITSNGFGVASVAPDARVCSVKVLDRDGGGNFGDIISGIMYVGTLGIDVANMSLGVLLPRNDPDTRALARAIQRAVNFSTTGVSYSLPRWATTAPISITRTSSTSPPTSSTWSAWPPPGRSASDSSTASPATATSVVSVWTCSRRAGTSDSPRAFCRTSSSARAARASPIRPSPAAIASRTFWATGPASRPRTSPAKPQ
jgi:subtilisin family serine protease